MVNRSLSISESDDSQDCLKIEKKLIRNNFLVTIKFLVVFFPSLVNDKVLYLKNKFLRVISMKCSVGGAQRLNHVLVVM